MRAYLSLAAAAAIAIAGSVASFAPAQATVRAAPALVVQDSAASVQLVHDRRYRQDRHHYRRHHVRRHYRHHRRHYYQPHVYYGYPRYYSRPGVSFSFSFGGGHHGYHGY
jgi:hypothetical protein